MSYVDVRRINWKQPRTDDEWAQLATDLWNHARDNYRKSAESFERSDTDGALTQWALDTTAREYNVAASLADDHGYLEYHALFTVDGELASTHHGFGQYGEYWVLNDKAARKFGKRFFNPSQARNPDTEYRNNRKKGFVIGRIRVRGYVTNLSGPDALTPIFGAVPYVDDLKAGNFEIISRDRYAEKVE